MTNVANVQFAGGLTIFVQAFTNALFQQTVNITSPSNVTAQFQGSGEGNEPMDLTTPGFLTPSAGDGWPSFVTAGAPNEISTYVVQCLNSGPNTSATEVNQATYSTAAGGVMYLATVVSEDSTDNDYNDSVTFLCGWSLPKARRAAVK